MFASASKALRSPLAGATLAAAATFTAAPAGAVELYLQAGLPGYGAGVAQPLNTWLTLRADYVTLGKRNKDTTEDGIAYNGELTANRAAAFADLYPFGGVFRISAGITSNKYQLVLDASGAGRTITVGSTNYVLGAGDGLTVEVKYPKSMPYLGLGWGHQMGSGFRFSFDLGAGIGKPTVNAVGRGQLAQPAAQADIDAELVELRANLGKVKVLPQLSFAIGYSF